MEVSSNKQIKSSAVEFESQALADSAGVAPGASSCPRITSPMVPSQIVSPYVAVSSVHVLKRRKIARLSRQWEWMKRSGGYIDSMPYYFAAPEDEDTVRHSLEHCQHTWLNESKGEVTRWRGIGCGRRAVCPVCGSYVQTVLANEAVVSMLAAQDGIEIGEGVQLNCHGFKLVLTIAKNLSESLDGLLLTDERAWRSEIDKLFKLAYKFVERWFGKGAGGVCALQYGGGSAPADAHYHLHGYIFPAVRQSGTWQALPRWFDEARLKSMRESWVSIVNKEFNMNDEDGNINCGYLATRGKLNHNLHYLYRHPLADLWAGWKGFEDGEILYAYARGSRRLRLGPQEMAVLASRLKAIPEHFKRIRWFGVFSDGQRGKTMTSFGLEPVEVKGEDDMAKVKWERTGETARFVRYVPEGVVLRKVLRDENGEGLRDQVEDIDGWPVFRERLGPEFIVPDSGIDYRPSGITIGKRKRWRRPGAS